MVDIRTATAMQNKPHFVVIGAAKSGTTSIFEYLRKCPEIYLPGVKEINFFDYKDRAARNRMQLSDYFSRFAGAKPHQLIGEVSTSYLFSKNAALEIQNHLGADTKIVAILRNPVDMIYSLWRQNRRDGGEQYDIKTALNLEDSRLQDDEFKHALNGWIYNFAYKKRALYAEQIQRYLELFAPENVRIYIFEEFFDDIESSMSDLQTFIGVKHPVKLASYMNYNPASTVRSRAFHNLYFRDSFISRTLRPVIPKQLRGRLMMLFYYMNTKPMSVETISPEDRIGLQRIFYNSVRELESLLGRDLSSIWF